MKWDFSGIQESVFFWNLLLLGIGIFGIVKFFFKNILFLDHKFRKELITSEENKMEKLSVKVCSFYLGLRLS